MLHYKSNFTISTKDGFEMFDWGSISIIGVLAATIATMVLGFLWYSPVLFGKAWVRRVGLKMEEMSAGGPLTYGLTALTALGGAFLLALLLTLVPSPSIGDGVAMGLLVGLSIAAKIGMNYLFEGKRFSLYLITIGYHVVSYVIAGAILGAMQQ
jgi:hypothetical protein